MPQLQSKDVPSIVSFTVSNTLLLLLTLVNQALAEAFGSSCEQSAEHIDARATELNKLVVLSSLQPVFAEFHSSTVRIMSHAAELVDKMNEAMRTADTTHAEMCLLYERYAKRRDQPPTKCKFIADGTWKWVLRLAVAQREIMTRRAHTCHACV